MLKSSSLTIRAVAAGIALAVALLLGIANVFAPLDLALYDMGLRYRVDHNPRPLNPAILKIDLNDSSEAALIERIDSREAFGDLLSILGDSGASAALDFVFPRARPGDESMIRAGAKYNNLIYAVIPIPAGYGAFTAPLDEANRKLLKEKLWHIRGDTEKLPQAISFVMSNADISSSATMLGHIGVSADKDGVYRRVPILYRWEDGVVPSLPLAMAVSELAIEPETLEWQPGRGLFLPMGEGEKPLLIPCDSEGNLLIPYGTRWETDQYRRSFADLIAADNDDLLSELFGALAIIADTTTSKRDFGVTPFEAVFPLSGIHAAVLSGILDEVFYVNNSFAFNALFILILFCLVLLLSLSGRDLIFHLGNAALLLLTAFTCFALWNWGNRSPWFCFPGFLVCSAWALGFVLRLFFRYREQLLYKTALARYFPRSLAERIAAEGKTELLPARKELTILFADIVGFTRWSSDKEAAGVHAFLSDYLESMAAILFEHGGTVDKFIGDGILAFFGDPVEQSDHARRCVSAAIDMQKKVSELAEKWRHAGIDLKIRIGINSGEVIAGNLGTKTRIEYTVIGSAVNLAQRMESNATPGGILAAEAAWEKTRDYFTYGGKRDITAKGYDAPVNAWEVVFT